MFVRPKSDRRMLYQQLKNSSVTVIVEASSEESFIGTGAVWDSSHIVTCYHILRDNPKSILVSDMKDVYQIDERLFTAVLVDAFPEIDIALIKLVDNEKIHINPVIRADVQEVFVGDEVFAICSVLGGKLPKSYLDGVISGVDRNAKTEMGVMIPGVLQTTVASVEGCSGSPLFTDSGYCVGICFGALCPSVAFAIPINMVHDAIAKFMEFQFSSHNLSSVSKCG
ncbi:protease Do-like 8, chloroplastic [Solanum pennellii]|uniref:Protease Do-like 8, chloroplastic n=1 Tax=Solanum pennellii TaxID=28526 RepID=A0ABM1GBA1_SOLPN|nr:protease Do-like 8, chloroplastic [Solanum pennellii]